MSIDIDDRVARLLAELHFATESPNEWAIKCLGLGFDSLNLRMLASMTQAYSPSEHDEKVRRVLEELGWADIHLFVYLAAYARGVAQEIVNDKRDPLLGAREIFKVLQATDSDEVGGWYYIDEMIFSREYYERTGEKDYFYLEKGELISTIKRACADFLQRTENSLGLLSNMSFEQAEEDFGKFLRDNEQAANLRWIFYEDVLIDGWNVSIRMPLPENNRERAKGCFELGKQRNLGVAFHSFCTLGDVTCCYVQLPEDDRDAQYKLMGNQFIKYSSRVGMPEASIIRNGLLWHVKRLFGGKNRHGYEDMIPLRTTLLPPSYKTDRQVDHH